MWSDSISRRRFIVKEYFASEIEPNAIKVTTENFPDTKEIGDVMNFVLETKDNNEIVLNEEKLKEFPKIDLVIFGSPCRSLSKATAGRKDYNNLKENQVFEKTVDNLGVNNNEDELPLSVRGLFLLYF